jgi:hypothetical protein
LGLEKRQSFFEEANIPRFLYELSLLFTFFLKVKENWPFWSGPFLFFIEVYVTIVRHTAPPI